MSWGSPDHDHGDLRNVIDETRWDAERQIRELRDEMYHIKREIYDDLMNEIASLREQPGEIEQIGEVTS
jgi:hypothetical protein